MEPEFESARIDAPFVGRFLENVRALTLIVPVRLFDRDSDSDCEQCECHQDPLIEMNISCPISVLSNSPSN
jgi:hypothetical protein